MIHLRKSFKAVLILLLISSFVLAACGKNDGSGNSSSSNNSGNTSNASTDSGEGAKETELSPVTLRVVVHGRAEEKDQARVVKAIEDYLRPTLNIKLKLDIIPFGEQSNLILSSGESVDLMFAAAWTGYNTQVTSGAFLQVDELLQKYGQDILNSNYNWTLSAGKYNGEQYGIPSYQEMAQQRGIMLRKDLADKYGPAVGFQINDLNNLEDLEPMLQAIKENEPNMIPLSLSSYLLDYAGAWDNNGDFDPAAVDIIDGKPQVINYYASDKIRQRIDLVRKWYNLGYINKDAATQGASAGNGEAEFGAGKAFSYVTITNPGYDVRISQRNSNIATAAYQVAPSFLITSNVQGAMFVIPSSAKNPERAMMFLNLLHTDKKLQNMLIYGEEEKDWVKVDDKVIKAAPGVDPASPPYRSQQYWMWGNQALLYAYEGSDPEAAKLLEDFNENAVQSPAFGFVWNPDDVKNEVAATTNVITQYRGGLLSGAIDPDKGDYYEKFLEKLKAAGVDKIIESKQRQLDEWFKMNK